VKNQIELILVHGWGFDLNCWEAWHSLAGKQLTQLFYDRGYFGAPDRLDVIMPTDRMRVVVAHSLGAHFLTPEILDKAHLLVIVAGFGQYHDGSTEQRRSRATTEAMRRKVSRSPLTVVSDFHNRCGYTTVFIADTSTFNTDLLATDLDLLDEHRLDLSILAKIPKTLLLHGGADQINPLRNSELLCEALPGAILRVHPEAPHALPFTHPKWCIDMINELVPIRSDVSTPA
jgi:pimeloyl-[acyl-carrier protein] methyl ester esterase